MGVLRRRLSDVEFCYKQLAIRPEVIWIRELQLHGVLFDLVLLYIRTVDVSDDVIVTYTLWM